MQDEVRTGLAADVAELISNVRDLEKQVKDHSNAHIRIIVFDIIAVIVLFLLAFVIQDEGIQMLFLGSVLTLLLHAMAQAYNTLG